MIYIHNFRDNFGYFGDNFGYFGDNFEVNFGDNFVRPNRPQTRITMRSKIRFIATKKRYIFLGTILGTILETILGTILRTILGI